MRLLQIDESTRGAHYFLRPDDTCLYLGDYTARGGYACSPINNLIHNIKKPVDREGRPEYQYKIRDMKRAGEMFRKALSGDALKSVTFVPVPPSKAQNDPAYDDRMFQILCHMANIPGQVVSVREIVVQRHSYAASHLGGQRKRPEDLVSIYEIDQQQCRPTPSQILIVDDVLTTGSHYVAMHTVLRAQFPDTWIGGLFIGRRKLDDDEDDFDVVEDDD